MRIIDTFNASDSFWDKHPQFLATNPFKDMWERDESIDKKESSMLMWFIVLCYDMDSKYINLVEKERHEIIGEDFCNDAEYYSKFEGLIEPCKEAYCKLQDTPAKRSLRNWKDKLEDRDAFLSTTKFTMDSYNDRGKVVKGTADQLDAMLGRTTKLWDDYERIMESMSKEESLGEGRGGAMPSSSDEGDI
jgi:hypothetical protein